MSLQGLHKCRCGVLDVFGYIVTANEPGDNENPNPERYAMVEITRVPSVYQKFVADQRNVRSGAFPPDHDPELRVMLPVDPEDENKPFICSICGVRVFWHGENKHPYLLAITSNTGESGLGGGYEDSTIANGYHLIDLLRPGTAPLKSAWTDGKWSSPEGGINWQFSYQVGPSAGPNPARDYLQFQQEEFWPMCLGVSKKILLFVEKNFDNDWALTQSRYVARLDLDSGEMTFGRTQGYGAESPGEYSIMLPSKINDDGNCWVVAQNIEDGVMCTGPSQPMTGTKESSSDVGHLALLPSSHVENVISGKPGWDSSINLPISYMRRNGKDYVLANAYALGVGLGLDWYYNGTTETWHNLGVTALYSDIYACDEGQVVIASHNRVLYIDAENTANSWEFVAPAGSFNYVSISANDDWIQVKGMLISNEHVETYATADIYGSNYAWDPRDTSGHPDGSTLGDQHISGWSFSRKSDGDGKPLTVVPHRQTNWVHWYDPNLGPSDPVNRTPWNARYLCNNRYTAIAERWKSLPGTYRSDYQSSGTTIPDYSQLLLARQVARGQFPFASFNAGHKNFDAVPGCSCGCVPDPAIGF